MRYAVLLLVLAAALVFASLRHGGLAFVLLWPATSAALIGAGYAGLGAWVLGKRGDGGRAIWATALHAGHIGVTLGIWHLLRALSRESPSDRVAPRLWLGRRPVGGELSGEVGVVIDVTAEMPVARGVTAGRGYRCFPILDGHIDRDQTLLAAARAVADEMEARTVYLHCAQGHARSAAVAAGALIARGLVAGVDEAEAILRRARPRVRMQPAQREQVRRLTPVLAPPRPKQAGLQNQ